MEILYCGFCLFNCEGGAYLAVYHNLVYSYPKVFLLLFSLVLSLIPILNNLSQFITQIGSRFPICSWVLLVLQSWSNYFEIIWYFAKFSFHHKCNEAWSLVINRSCPTSCSTIWELGSQEIRKYQENLKTS